MSNIAPTLSSLQRQFARCLSALYAKILTDGYEFTLGEAWRTNEQAEINALSLVNRRVVEALLAARYPTLAQAIGQSQGVGITASVHRDRLAQDINLFHNGIFLTKADDYRIFGTWWKTQHPMARYGGDFGDFDHFSFEHHGAK